ncbi:hypothetical protein VTI28DRAFT_8866 [Corynascus sepedonium]
MSKLTLEGKNGGFESDIEMVSPLGSYHSQAQRPQFFSASPQPIYQPHTRQPYSEPPQLQSQRLQHLQRQYSAPPQPAYQHPQSQPRQSQPRQSQPRHSQPRQSQSPLPSIEEGDECDSEEFSDEDEIQPLITPLTRSENSIFFRQAHIVQQSAKLDNPLASSIPVEFKVGRSTHLGMILYKVVNSRYLYTVVNTGEDVEKAFLLKAKDFPDEAAQIAAFHPTVTNGDLFDIEGFVINTVAMVVEGKRVICVVEGAAVGNSNMWVCTISVLKTRWSSSLVVGQVKARRKEQKQLNLL